MNVRKDLVIPTSNQNDEETKHNSSPENSKESGMFLLDNFRRLATSTVDWKKRWKADKIKVPFFSE